jgi:RNA polymerase sigma-70 factor, ECF subfamily
MRDRRPRSSPEKTTVTKKNSSPDAETRLNSFMTLFLHEQARLYQFTVTLLANTADADDVFQETSLALWQAFGQFKPGTDFYRWARQVAYNRILNHWRREHRGVQYLDPDVLGLIASDAEELDGEPNGGAELSLAALLDCMKRLSEEDRHLIHRSYADNASGRQLSEELGRPVNSIYKSLGRIRRTLMKCTEREMTARRREEEIQ